MAGDDSDRTVAIVEADAVEGGKEDFVSTPENVRPLKMNCRGVLVSHKIWAGDETSELERIFCESQIFLKYFRSFSRLNI